MTALDAMCYALLNILSASGIVFANKVVFQGYEFNFPFALTFLHTVTTVGGMHAFARLGMFETKRLPVAKLVDLAAAYVGYIVLCNLNLKINTVGFYQVTKIAVAPAVLLLEWLLFGRRASSRVVLSIALVCAGVALSTLSEVHDVAATAEGVWIGAGAVAATALYQIWAGSKQRELGAGSMQLLHQYSPIAAAMLGTVTAVWEPIGLRSRDAEALLGYPFTAGACVAILLSALLGLLVSLSTFLVIGATSSLTYNVVGHIKTVIILTGGCLFFGDEMPPKKCMGICVAMGGIVWYSQLTLNESVALKRTKDSLPVTNGQPKQ